MSGLDEPTIVERDIYFAIDGVKDKKGLDLLREKANKEATINKEIILKKIAIKERKLPL